MEQLRQRVERLKYENHQLEEMLANAEEQVGGSGWGWGGGGVPGVRFIRQ